MKNTLFYGDNLDIMNHHMKNHSVDLIYLDPPFKSNQNYNLLYKTMTGRPVPEQADAFCDTWDISAEKIRLAKNMPILMKEHGIDDSYVQFWRLWIMALQHTQPHLLAYLIYMVERMIHMKSILKKNGSIYLHCDPTASHYIKVMMDGIFGHQNFRNELIWKRTFAHGGASRWGDIHDTILFYTASDKYTWNKILQAHDETYLADKYRFTDKRGRYRLVVLTGPGTTKGASGQEWRGYNPTTAGRHWAVPRRAIEMLRAEGISIPTDLHDQLELLFEKGFIRFPQKADGSQGVPEFKLYLPKGQPAQDLILDIPPINSQSSERLGYPTQKPIALLDRIIRASSNKGDRVFDPFCGCGTTIYAAHEAGREWVGCDVAILAVKLVEKVLAERYRLVEGTNFVIDGIPLTVEQAKDLFNRSPTQFQNWAVERAGGFPTQVKSGDRGVDGRLYFETRTGLKDMVISVKGGAIRPADIRELRGTLERESTPLAGFISLRDPTPAMVREGGEAGSYEYAGMSYPRLQFLTVKDMLENERGFVTPTKVKTTKIDTGQVLLGLD